jgi:hypothetical protein
LLFVYSFSCGKVLPAASRDFLKMCRWFGRGVQGTSLGVFVDLDDPAEVYENVRQVKAHSHTSR